MSRPAQLTSWDLESKRRFPGLSAPAVAVLALYSFGVLLAHGCGLSLVCLAPSKTLRSPYSALRKRLSEFYKESSAKSGTARRDLEVASCFPPLLRWILSLWAGRQLPPAVDVTNLGERFHVPCVSVVVGGVGIPAAWKVLHGNTSDPWNPHWQSLLRRLKRAVPDDWTVVVLSDRGLESPELFRFIVSLGWHPLMRAKKGGKFEPSGWRGYHGMGDLARRVGDRLASAGLAYAGEKMPCTLLARWGEGHAEAWLILTDPPGESAEAAWYAMRSWIEQAFEVTKGGDWDWHRTRMEDPARVERLWLVLAVATLWVVAVGAEDERRERIRREQAEQQRRMGESQEQARRREERERHRLQKSREAHRAQRGREEARRRAGEEERQAKKRSNPGKKKGRAETAARQPSRPQRPKRAAAKQRRLHRLSTSGIQELKGCWNRGESRPPRCLHPDPWPPPCNSPRPITEDDFIAQQT